jgi:TatD DNase family protein
MIDTHAHLTFDWFDDDREEVIERAREAGVEQIITVGTNLQDCGEAIELAERHPHLFAAVGIHPNDSEDFSDEALARLREWCRHPKVVAVGEIGLDFYRDRVPPERQEKAFRAQIALAKEVGLPVIIHNREATRALLEVLQEVGTEGLSGVFHCFSGNLEDAEQVLSLGFLISFAGNLTYKKSNLPEIAAAVPLERQLLETDSPFLAPMPRRGKRNEPAFVVHTAQRLAEIKGVDVATVAQVTTANARRLFDL